MSYFACMSHVIIKFLFFVSIILLTFIYVVIHIHGIKKKVITRLEILTFEIYLINVYPFMTFFNSRDMSKL